SEVDLLVFGIILNCTLCGVGWKKFDGNCYFVSKLSRTWAESRLDCISRGADLVVINSREEQVFLNGLLGRSKDVWIGLSDHIKEGTWVWVDGTPLTTEFWQNEQPNNLGNQDCVEIQTKSSRLGTWNDVSCSLQQPWICEK
uniref:CD209 antigen-like n=1 Tax=Hippocampus comes TaxID=109280 RepID=A0A3Q2XRY0_HIPCM